MGADLFRVNFLYANTNAQTIAANITTAITMIVAGLNTDSTGFAVDALTVIMVAVEFTAAPEASVTSSMKVQLPVAVEVEVIKR